MVEWLHGRRLAVSCRCKIVWQRQSFEVCKKTLNRVFVSFTIRNGLFSQRESFARFLLTKEPDAAADQPGYRPTLLFQLGHALLGQIRFVNTDIKIINQLL